MTGDRAERVEELFALGVELKPSERGSFLERECGSDVDLRAEVEALLISDDSQSEEFLSTPPINFDALPPGTVIAGKYKSLELLGEGGMGMVYLAEQLHPVRRRVAIKVLKLGMDTRQVIARFEAERQALAMMDHPSIARVLDAGATEVGRPFFAMELVRGIPITKYCDEQKLSTRERIELFLSVIDAIQHAHHKGVIHRDIKPGNILVSLESGRAIPKVIDFGVAKATSQPLTEKTLHTTCGQLVGTPEYMSPEQAGMSELDIDTRSDVYSLGAVLYELLTGSKPFRASTASFLDIQRQICETHLVRPSSRVTRVEESDEREKVRDTNDIARVRSTDPVTLSRELKRDLDWVISCAMAKDRTRRYETASALGSDLRRFLASQPVEARPPSAAYRMHKFIQRNRAGVIGAASVVVVLVAGSVTTTALAISEARQRGRVVSALEAERIAKQDAKQQEALASEAAQIAELAAAKSEAVNLFLEAMITSARTQSARGRDVTMREVLDATTARLDSGELVDLPMVEEEVRDIIGRTYLDLGLPRKAAESLRWSYVHSLQTRGELADETISALDVYAEAVKEQVGEQSLAIRLHEQLYEITSRARGEDDPTTLLALDGLANSLMRDSRAAEAIPLHERAREGLVAAFGEKDPRAILPLFNIGGCQRLLGDYENAERTYRQVIAAFDRTGMRIANIRARIELASGVLYPMGKRNEGMELLREAVALGEDVLGVDHAEVISGRFHIARIMWRQGDDAGRDAFREVVDARKRVFGDRSAEYASAVLSQGQMLMDIDADLRGAKAAFEIAYDIFKDLPDVQRQIASCSGRIVHIDLIRGEVNQTLELAVVFEQASTEALGPDHDFTLLAQLRRALVMAGIGQAEQAEPVLRRVFSLLQQRHGDSHSRVALAMWSLGHCLELLGDEDGLDMFVRGVRLHHESRGDPRDLDLAKRYLREMIHRRGLDASSYAELLAP